MKITEIFNQIRIQALILKFPDPDKFVQDKSWRVLSSEIPVVFNSRDSLRLAMLHDVLVATMYEKYSGLKIVFNYGIFMDGVNDNERHYNLVVNELPWLKNFTTTETDWQIRISNTPEAWQGVMAIVLGGFLSPPHYQKVEQAKGAGDGNFYDPDRPLHPA